MQGRHGGRALNSIDINSDLGESFGPWCMGDDKAMLDVVTSANIACGFHAGDPRGILFVLREAASRDVAVGAHVGYRDLVGFGRRNLDLSSDELVSDTIYQIGALQALAHVAGTRVSYVKPHGALYNTIAFDRRQATDVVKALKTLDPSLPLVALSGSPLVSFARDAGLTVVCEAFADRAYNRDGTLVSRRASDAVIHDANEVAERMLRLVQEGVICAVDGTDVPVEAQTICVHGDNPAAVAVAGLLRERLVIHGITPSSFVSKR